MIPLTARAQDQAVPVRRIALVGGGHAARLHRDALGLRRDFAIEAVHDPDPPGPCAETWRRAPTLEALVAETGCDVVAVCTPPAAHAPVAALALAAGKSVLIEKPVTPDAASFSRLQANAACADGIVYSALHAAFGREVRWAAEQLSGLVDPGPLVRFRSEFTDPYLDTAGAVTPRARSLGGPWLDSAINALSVIGRLTPLDGWAMTRVRVRASTSAQAVIASLEGLGQARGGLVTRWDGRPSRKTTLAEFASGVRLSLDHMAQSARLEAGGRILTLRGATAPNPRLIEHYLALYDDFDAHLREGRGNLAQASAAHRLVHEGQERIAHERPLGA